MIRVLPRPIRVATVSVAVFALGCAAGPFPLPDLGGLYNQAAQAGDELTGAAQAGPRSVRPLTTSRRSSTS